MLQPRNITKKSGNYFTSTKKDVLMYSSGCALLDNVLGGGYPLGRMTNIVGDKSSGKTLLAIEACANFVKTYKKGSKVWYFEAESAFDKSYAEALGLPLEKVEFVNDLIQDEKYAARSIGSKSPADLTVETLFEHLDWAIQCGGYEQGLYIVDSLDALSDRAEQARKIDDGSYGTKKAAKMSELFRRLVAKLERSKIHLIIVSQVRDNIGVTFGSKNTRSGGRAMDFYASQVLWLAEVKKLRKTINKVERVVGVEIKAQCKKNKIGLPFRECVYPIYFGYGIDDVKAHLDWLDSNGKTDLADLGIGKTVSNIYTKFCKMDPDRRNEIRQQLSDLVISEWRAIEDSFLPERRKY
jgi:recombination protein RecA